MVVVVVGVGEDGVVGLDEDDVFLSDSILTPMN